MLQVGTLTSDRILPSGYLVLRVTGDFSLCLMLSKLNSLIADTLLNSKHSTGDRSGCVGDLNNA